MAAHLAYAYRFVPATVPGRAPLLLLHGTGGDENDLVPLGASLSPGAALLSPRGNVLEQGMPRFFRRLAEGVFDPAEIRRRAGELAAFVAEARHVYDVPAPIAVGFSNGANIAAVLLALHPGTLAGGVLFRPMTVLEDDGLPGDPTAVLILLGATDPIVPADSVASLASRLRHAGHPVDHETLRAGHGLTQVDVARATAWLADRSGDPA